MREGGLYYCSWEKVMRPGFLGQALTNKTFTIRLITELWRTSLMAPIVIISAVCQYNFKLSMLCLINIVNHGVEEESKFRVWNATKKLINVMN